MKIQFLGSGDAFGSGGRFNSCFHVTTRGSEFLIDCGASSMVAIRRFGVQPNSIGSVFISHLHGDHFGGLPFFILDAQFYSRRSEPLSIVGPPGLKERLKQSMEVFFPGSSEAERRFDIELLELQPGEPSTLGSITVTPYEVRHACGAPPFALRFECGGKTITYSGDTEWTHSLVEASQEADLLIAEALFFDKKIKWHMDYASLRRHHDELGAKRIILTHLGPDMLGRLNDLAYETASDGMILEL